MLFGRGKTPAHRVTRLAVWTTTIAGAGIILAFLGSLARFWHWPPQSSSAFGVACGLLGAGIILFEMALLPRKWCRGWRLGATRLWMKLHVWLGLLALPVVLLHTGFHFGGPLPAFTLVLFLLVMASGLWGLAVQQWLPQKLHANVDTEAIASQISTLGQFHALEAGRLFDSLFSTDGIATEAARTWQPFRENIYTPYIQMGRRSHSPLAVHANAKREFDRLRESFPDEAATIDRLEAIRDQRRQWDVQLRLTFWLHNWLWVHLPLAVAMTGLMFIHAIRALKYW